MNRTSALDVNIQAVSPELAVFAGRGRHLLGEDGCGEQQQEPGQAGAAAQHRGFL